jgi:hypothetical protein
VAAMTFSFNPGFLAVAFMEGSAACVLLVLYWLLLPGFPARFFRYWLAGWAVYTGLEGLRIYSLWRGGSNDPRFAPQLSLLAAALFFAAIMACRDRGKSVIHLWSLGVIAASGLIALDWFAKLPHVERWVESAFQSLLYLSAGWVFWRAKSQHRGIGWKLLAAALLLRGLHGLDRPFWGVNEAELFRVSFQGLFGIMMGIAMPCWFSRPGGVVPKI